jgi:hypothetical protein
MAWKLHPNPKKLHNIVSGDSMILYGQIDIFVLKFSIILHHITLRVFSYLLLRIYKIHNLFPERKQVGYDEDW